MRSVTPSDARDPSSGSIIKAARTKTRRQSGSRAAAHLRGPVELPPSVRGPVLLASDAGVDLREAVPVLGPNPSEPRLNVLGRAVVKGPGERVRVAKADVAQAVSKDQAVEHPNGRSPAAVRAGAGPGVADRDDTGGNRLTVEVVVADAGPRSWPGSPPGRLVVRRRSSGPPGVAIAPCAPSGRCRAGRTRPGRGRQ